MIAATAMIHRLKVATRNVKDFDGFGVDLVNPFELQDVCRFVFEVAVL